MPVADTFSQVGSVATAIGVLLVVPGIVYAGLQLRATQKVASGDFLLRLDGLLTEHNDVHTRLRPGGLWAKPGSGPQSVQDWVAVERYMGLFERIYVLIGSGIIDLTEYPGKRDVGTTDDLLVVKRAHSRLRGRRTSESESQPHDR